MIPILLGHKKPMGSETITVTGTNGHDLTARILPGGGPELAIFLPGLTYRNDRAGLHYPQLMMRSRGVDVMAVNYTYDSNVSFQSLPEAEQLEWIGSDGLAILEAALDRGIYERLTIVGK